MTAPNFAQCCAMQIEFCDCVRPDHITVSYLPSKADKCGMISFDDAPPVGELADIDLQDYDVAYSWTTPRDIDLIEDWLMYYGVMDTGRPPKGLLSMTCNMSADEIAQRDRKVSRQERRQNERLARKGRA